MATKISEVMSHDLVTVAPQATLAEAAQQMREDDIGDVLVAENGHLRGILTDRDIVVRAVADDRTPHEVKVADICSSEVTVIRPDDPIDRAVALMRQQAVRRLPVVTDGDELVGVISLGDLAIERDGHSALADISAAEPNN